MYVNSNKNFPLFERKFLGKIKNPYKIFMFELSIELSIGLSIGLPIGLSNGLKNNVILLINFNFIDKLSFIFGYVNLTTAFDNQIENV